MAEQQMETIPPPVIKDERPLFNITYTKQPGDPVKALEILRQRVLEAGLKPIEHKSQCLNGRKEYFGLFGSLLKGTNTGHSDIDFAVWMPRDFFEKMDKYVKGVLDRVFFMIKASYGWIAYGEVNHVDVDLYFIYPNLRFHAFEIDGALACLLSDGDKDYVKKVKDLGRFWGVVGEYGGVPGVALEWGVIYAREKGLTLGEVLRWDYLPARPLMGTVAGNLLGRTFRINQEILADLVSGVQYPDPPTEEQKYLSAVAHYARRKNLVFEYYVVREMLPISLIYASYIKSLQDIMGAERAKYVGREVGIFGPVGYNGYVMGLALPAVIWKEHTKAGVSPDRLSLITPSDCWLEIGGPVIRFEGGLQCKAESLRSVDLKPTVVRLYSIYKGTLSSIYDRYVTIKVV